MSNAPPDQDWVGFTPETARAVVLLTLSGRQADVEPEDAWRLEAACPYFGLRGEVVYLDCDATPAGGDR